MVKKPALMDRYGLIGQAIGYSFSRSYFKAKFDSESVAATYVNFDCATIDSVRECLKDKRIRGYNVTIPYKEAIIPLLDGLDPHAEKIGAVNTIKRLEDGSLIGYNTDYVGFRDSLLEQFGTSLFSTLIHNERALEAKKLPSYKALILGTGGASKAVIYAFGSLGVHCQYVSRKRTQENLSYDELDEAKIVEVTFIVNCTPLGTHPDIDLHPDIPFLYLDSRHIAYDLIYNPAETRFLALANAQKVTTINGLRMLELQAEASWAIWNMP
jgi:shikimate dehydrogenase